MKTWHYIAIGGAALIVLCLIVRSRGTANIPVLGDKVGTDGVNQVGAPPLPNVSYAKIPTATYLAFSGPKIGTGGRSL